MSAEPQDFKALDLQDAERKQIEHRGNRYKVWIARGAQEWLFKQGRPGTPEDVTEILVQIVAEALGVPCAKYQLARLEDRGGVISEKFHDDSVALVLGNELLVETDPDVSRFRNVFHTLTAIENGLAGVGVNTEESIGIADAFDVFVGYLMLDAVVGNTDRHHENWGILKRGGDSVLAPSFDHASSLGVRLTEPERQNRLVTRDRGRSIDSYVRKAKSAIYPEQAVGNSAPLSTLECFQRAARMRPAAARHWLEQLQALEIANLDRVFE
jgi:HipA-like C-terminal domain